MDILRTQSLNLRTSFKCITLKGPVYIVLEIKGIVSNSDIAFLLKIRFIKNSVIAIKGTLSTHSHSFKVLVS